MRKPRDIFVASSSVAATTAPANATATGERFPREPDMLGDRTRKRIPVSPHEIAGEVTALPWFHVGTGAQAETCEAEEEFE